MTLKYESVDKIAKNVYWFVGRHAGGPSITGGSVVLTTDPRKWRTP